MADHSYTASYTNCMHSFIVTGIPSGRIKEGLPLSFTCIIRNILSRSKSVKPSIYLSEHFGAQPDNLTPLVLIDKSASLPNWNETIKGSESGFNPAKTFFYDDALWSRILPGKEWIRQLLIPEAPLEQILGRELPDFKNQATDFFLPDASLVIEIDGEQHNTPAQAAKDKKRDELLEANKILTVRIPVRFLRDNSSELETRLHTIRERIWSSKRIIEYDAHADEDLSSPLINYERVLRYQFAFLALVESGQLSLDQKVWTIKAAESEHESITYAVHDLFLWYLNLYQLRGLAFAEPDLIFANEPDAIEIHCNLFSRPDDSRKSGVQIYNNPWEGTDWYRVSVAPCVDYRIPWAIKDAPLRKEALHFFLKNIFHYDTFKPGQLEIIGSALNRQRTIGILPTGGGKSLCYQLAAILQPALCFDVCPIVSLILDQKSNLDQLGWTRTDYIEGSMKGEAKEAVLNAYRELRTQIIWISPERFQNREFRSSIKAINEMHGFSYAIIDEVHCLSEWGHDFRPSYLTLVSTIENNCSSATIFGLTATASQAVLNDLKIELKVNASGVCALPSLERSNLTLQVIETKDQNAELIRLLAKHHYGSNNEVPDTGIIFTLTQDRSDTENDDYGNKTARLVKDTFPANRDQIGIYHGGINPAAKQSIQQDFINGKLRLLSATKAFGMGVNKKDLRFTIHKQLPWSVECFYQEAGRAGRDGEPASCYILFNEHALGGKEIQKKLFDQYTSPEEIAGLNVKGDLRTIFLLWGRNNKGVSHDLGVIKSILDFKAAHSPEMDANGKAFYRLFKNKDDHETEPALYKLKLLSVVDDWMISFIGLNPCFEIFFHNSAFTDDHIVEQSFFRYIRRYSVKFGDPWDEKSQKYRDIIETGPESPILRYSRALIEWTYDNIVFMRRLATKNILTFCKECSKNPDEFRNRIDNYLSITDLAIQMDQIVTNPDYWNRWPQFFQITIMNPDGSRETRLRVKEQIQELQDTIARSQETYRDNPVLTLVDILCHAIRGTYGKDLYPGNDALERVLKDIHDHVAEISAQLPEQIIQLCSDYSEEIGPDIIDNIMLNLAYSFPEKDHLMYQNHPSPSILALIMERLTKKLQNAMEVIQ